jgi:hypothetical protein
MEPYERDAWMITAVLTLVWLAALLVWGLGNALTATAVYFALACLTWSFLVFFMDRIKNQTANHMHLGNIGLKSCFNPEPLMILADDPETGAMGSALYTFGGGGGSGIHLRDGGTNINSGGYVIVPRDAPIKIEGGLTIFACNFSEIAWDALLEQEMTTIRDNGFHPTNTHIYKALVHVASFTPPSLKVSKTETMMQLESEMASSSRRKAQDVGGDLATVIEQLDHIQASRNPTIARKARKMMRMDQEDSKSEEEIGP